MKLEITKENRNYKKILTWLSDAVEQDQYLKVAVDNCPDKTLDSCWDYVYKGIEELYKVQIETAKKSGLSGCCVPIMDDDIVYDLAREYFLDYEAIQQKKAEEKAKKEKEEAERKAKAEENKKKAEAKAKGKAKPKAEPKTIDEVDSFEDDEEDEEPTPKTPKPKKAKAEKKVEKTEEQKKLEEQQKLVEERRAKLKQLSIFDLD